MTQVQVLYLDENLNLLSEFFNINPDNTVTVNIQRRWLTVGVFGQNTTVQKLQFNYNPTEIYLIYSTPIMQSIDVSLYRPANEPLIFTPLTTLGGDNNNDPNPVDPM